MSIYVGPLVGCLASSNFRHTKSAHLLADAELELLTFGEKLGCRTAWAHRSNSGVLHFDLTERMRSKAIRMGAKTLDRAGEVAKAKELKL